MKTATKAWLIIAACLIVIGGGIFAGGMKLAHWDFGSFGTAKLETNTYVISDKFSNITIECDTEDIAFLLSEDGQCRVVFYESEQRQHFARVEGGTLQIGVVDTRGWQQHLFGSGSPTITVYLPKGAYGQLAIAEDTGDVTLPKDFSFRNIGIDISTGDVECSASVTERIHIKTSTGDIRLIGAAANAIDLEVSTGRVEADAVKCTGELSVTVSTGKAFLTNVTCDSLMTTGNTGAITLTDVVATGSMTIKRTTGDVTFERSDAAELLVSTDTGDVTGTLRSAKVFIVNTGTGKVDVPETTTGGKCKIITSTGNIKITVM